MNDEIVNSNTLATHRYNPLSFVPQNKLLRINYIQILAHILYKTQNDKGEPWQPSARSMFMAIVLYLMDTPGMQVTLGAVLRTVKRKDFDKFLEGLVEHRPDLDPLCVANFSEHLQKAYKEQSGVKTTLSTGLELWENPTLEVNNPYESLSSDVLDELYEIFEEGGL